MPAETCFKIKKPMKLEAKFRLPSANSLKYIEFLDKEITLGRSIYSIIRENKKLPVTIYHLAYLNFTRVCLNRRLRKRILTLKKNMETKCNR